MRLAGRRTALHSPGMRLIVLTATLAACASAADRGVPCRDGGWGGGCGTKADERKQPRPPIAEGVPPIQDELTGRRGPEREAYEEYRSQGYPERVARDLARRDTQRQD